MQATLFASGVEFTSKNLLAAYQGEMNTRARYAAYATRADAEGLYGIASLFRAAARAEQIHATNQARVLRQMGAVAETQLYPCQVRETLENLRSALSGEHYEIYTMYPAFIDEARAQINSNAARSFVWALEAEKSHARLFGEAVGLLEMHKLDSWISAPRDYHVCPVCANTSEYLPVDNCSICQYPADRFELIR